MIRFSSQSICTLSANHRQSSANPPNHQCQSSQLKALFRSISDGFFTGFALVIGLIEGTFFTGKHIDFPIDFPIKQEGFL